MASNEEWNHWMRIILLTGSSGVGKTTMVMRIAERLVSRGLKVAGITSREARERGWRMGFRIEDLSTGREGWLARKGPGEGLRIGSYHVINEDLLGIGVEALRRAANDRTDLVIVDEIGPMEMISASFRSAVAEVFQAHQPILATIKLGSDYEEVENIRENSLQLELTKENREQIYATLIDQIDKWLDRKEPTSY